MNTVLETDVIGENHIATSIDTPMRVEAFELTDIQKIKIIAEHFEHIMYTLGLDLTDDSLKDTPLRVAKMYVKFLVDLILQINRNPFCSIISISIKKC